MASAEIYVGDPDLTLKADIVPGFLLVRLGNRTRHTLSSVQVSVVAVSPAEILSGPVSLSLPPVAMVTVPFAFISTESSTCVIVAIFRGPDGIIAQSQISVRLIPSDRETLSRLESWAVLFTRLGSQVIVPPQGTSLSPSSIPRISGGHLEALLGSSTRNPRELESELAWGCVDPVLLLKVGLAGERQTRLFAPVPLLPSYCTWVESLFFANDGGFLLARGYEVGRLVAILQDYLDLGRGVAETLAKVYELARVLSVAGIVFSSSPVEAVLRGHEKLSELAPADRAVVDQWLIHVEHLASGRIISSLAPLPESTEKASGSEVLLPIKHENGGNTDVTG